MGPISSSVQKKEEFKIIQDKTIRKFADIVNSSNSTGDNIHNCRNAKNCFIVNNSENIKYCWRVPEGFKDCFDTSGALNLELCYEGVVAGTDNYNVKFYLQNRKSKNLDYCLFCQSSSHLFGCVGLRNKEYCILNKQYTKEEYERMVPKIIDQMNSMPYVDKKGRVYKYGEFFPPELSPFCYNETIAQEYFPLTKEQAIEKGYRWKDPEERNLTIDIRTEEIPDHIKDVKDDIIGKVIECANAKPQIPMANDQPNASELTSDVKQLLEYSNCTTAFKLISQELAFYRRMNLPLPRLCPNCRHYERLKQRNPLKLWRRQCMCRGLISRGPASGYSYRNTVEHFHGDKPCPNSFETTYAPDRPEIVYCEECYKREVN